MNTHIKLFIFTISISTLLFQGCEKTETTVNYPTALGDSASTTTADENAVMAIN